MEDEDGRLSLWVRAVRSEELEHKAVGGAVAERIRSALDYTFRIYCSEDAFAEQLIRMVMREDRNRYQALFSLACSADMYGSKSLSNPTIFPYANLALYRDSKPEPLSRSSSYSSRQSRNSSRSPSSWNRA